MAGKRGHSLAWGQIYSRRQLSYQFPDGTYSIWGECPPTSPGLHNLSRRSRLARLPTLLGLAPSCVALAGKYSGSLHGGTRPGKGQAENVRGGYSPRVHSCLGIWEAASKGKGSLVEVA